MRKLALLMMAIASASMLYEPREENIHHKNAAAKRTMPISEVISAFDFVIYQPRVPPVIAASKIAILSFIFRLRTAAAFVSFNNMFS